MTIEYKNNIDLFLQSLAEHFGIDRGHGWKKALVKALNGLNLKISGGNLLNKWIGNNYIPDDSLNSFLALNIPDNLKALCEACRKPRKDTAKKNVVKSVYPEHKKKECCIVDTRYFDLHSPYADLHRELEEILIKGDQSTKDAIISNIHEFHARVKDKEKIKRLEAKAEEFEGWKKRVAMLEVKVNGP